MPLHERRTVFVEIDSGRRDRIFGIGAVRIFTAAMKNVRPAMNLFHRLQQELNDFRMQVVANQNFGRGADQLHIYGRDILIDIDDTLRQNEAIEVRKIRVKASAIGKLISRTLGFAQKRLDAVASARQ